MRDSHIAILALGIAALVSLSACTQIFPNPLAHPERTDWSPKGCRVVPAQHPVLPSRAAWRNLHADSINTDEISVALAPVFKRGWIAEASTYQATGAVFDDDGNLYVAPLMPYESVVLISLDPQTGARRWAIDNTTGALSGGSAPMVLEDPDSPGDQIIYLTVYDRALAVRPDGTIIWDVPTGLTQSGTLRDLVLGLNYLPKADAIVGLSNDGFIYLLDRKTGAQLLSMPYQLPGAPLPEGPSSSLPPELKAQADVIFRSLVNLPAGSDLGDFQDILLGNNTEVANHFSIEPRSGRLFIAGSAPDEADGTADGVSEIGAIYGLELIQSPAGYRLTQACSRFFEGGSASTPALRADGTRLYVGDNFGKLIAISPDCSDAWELEMDNPIFGSIAVSSDNHELYAASPSGVFQVIDRDDEGEISWSANLDVFRIPPALESNGFVNINLNLVGIGANGLFVQAGAGVFAGGTIIPVTVGIAHLDRDDGTVRWFAEGLEETVGVMSTGPDGALYVGNSPLRRIAAFILGETGDLPPSPPVIGGITKWMATRLDLLARDATCAASDRITNTAEHYGECPESVVADVDQARALMAQATAAASGAIKDGDLSIPQWLEAKRELQKAKTKLDAGNLQALHEAAESLNLACDTLDSR